jgi:hypothetical protein
MTNLGQRSHGGNPDQLVPLFSSPLPSVIPAFPIGAILSRITSSNYITKLIKPMHLEKISKGWQCTKPPRFKFLTGGSKHWINPNRLITKTCKFQQFLVSGGWKTHIKKKEVGSPHQPTLCSIVEFF